MVQINGTYLGDLRCEAIHLPSGNHLVTDAPVDNNGKGEAFSPTDLVATATATCMMTIMGILAKRRNLDLSQSTFSVVKEMSTEAPRRIQRLSLTFHLPAGLTEEDRLVLERGAHTCPVHQSLNSAIEVLTEFLYDR